MEGKYMLNNVKRIVKGIKLNVELIKGIKNDNNSLFIKPEEIQPGGYVQRQNTVLLVKQKLNIAGCTTVKIGFRTVPYIITDSIFNLMSKETQDFIINHELGHFYCHKNLLDNGFERNDKMEFEADEYSANVVGIENAINALKEIKETLDILGFGKAKECINEFDRRIENLNKLLVNI
jgi:Zn-dependent peptidase ImmA (M78 family)